MKLIWKITNKTNHLFDRKDNMKQYKWCERPCNKCEYKQRVEGCYSPVCTKRWKWKLIRVPWCNAKGINDLKK